MRKLFVASVACLSLMAIVGCQKPSGGGGTSGGIAIVDLDKIATSMGWLDEMSRNLQGADAELKNQVNGIVQNGVKAIQDAKKKVSEEAKLTEAQVKSLDAVRDMKDLEALPLTPEQRTLLVNTVNQANQTLQNASQEYQKIMQAQRTQLIVRYREKIRPVARRVANAKGMSVVLIPSDSILYSDSGVDITNDVIDELLKSGEAKVTPATAPPTTPKAAAPTTPATTTPATTPKP